MKNFVTLFYNFKEVHFYKDVGMIPYYMAENYNYNSYIACKEENYNKLDNINVIKKSNIKSVFNNEFLDILLYIIRTYKKIDVLNLYHYRKKTLIYIFLYKFLNKNGKVYLKLDGNGLNNKKNINKIEMNILKKCEIISTEIFSNYIDLKNRLNLKNVEYIPNGSFMLDEFKNKKQNIICFAGRIGAYEKSVDTLVEAFIKSYEHIEDWYLYLIGPITKEFTNYLNLRLESHKKIKKKIILHGNIDDKEKLFSIYNKCKIFCLPSLFESFGIAAVEAMSQGCYLLLSNFESANDLTKDEQIGSIFKAKNVNELSEIMIDICNKDSNFFEKKSLELKEYYNKRFSYEINCEKIEKLLR